MIVFYHSEVGDKNMRTSSLVQFGIGALIALLFLLPVRRPRAPRFGPRPEPTDAELTAKRQKSWEAYLKERAGGHQTPHVDDSRQEDLPADE